jgi:high affinity sulfate transporter 1
MADASATSAARARLPLLQGLLPLDRRRIPFEIIAGVTLAALAIPEVMGYTKIAGMPVVTGLYTILIPMAVFAVLGSSRHLVVGADSATAAIMAAGLGSLAASESSEYVALAGMLALMAGGLLLLARLLRLGFLADFLSRTVLIGFLTGVGIQVACGQFSGLFGIPKSGHGPIAQVVNTFRDWGDFSRPTLVVSVAVLLVIVVGGRLFSRLPWALIAVVGAIVASAALDLSAHGVATLGTIPSGLPHFALPDVPASDLDDLAATAVSIFVVVLAQSAATSRAYAVKYGDPFDENVDLVGLGGANLAAGLCGTFVVNGSPTKTEMVDSAGGRSQLAQATTAAIVLVVLLFLTKPLSYMPQAVLASVVFLIGVRLVDVKGMRLVYRRRPVEFWVALITAAIVVLWGVEQGIVLAIALSIVAHLRHSYRPHDRVMIMTPGGLPAAAPLDGRAQLAPGLVVYRFGANVYYANAGRLATEIDRLVDGADPPLVWFCLNAAAIGDIDFSGSAVLQRLQSDLAKRGVALVLCNVHDEVRAELDRDGLTAQIGVERLFSDVEAVVTAFHERDTGGGKDS